MEKWSHFTTLISLAAPARSMDIELILIEDPIDFASRRFYVLVMINFNSTITRAAWITHDNVFLSIRKWKQLRYT